MNPFAESVLKELQRAIAAQQEYIAYLQRRDQRENPDTEREETLKEAAMGLTALIEGYITMSCTPEEGDRQSRPTDRTSSEG